MMSSRVRAPGKNCPCCARNARDVRVAAGEPLLEQPVEVADHLAVGGEILRRDVAERLRQAVHVLVEELAAKPLQQLVEAVAAPDSRKSYSSSRRIRSPMLGGRASSWSSRLAAMSRSMFRSWRSSSTSARAASPSCGGAPGLAAIGADWRSCRTRRRRRIGSPGRVTRSAPGAGVGTASSPRSAVSVIGRRPVRARSVARRRSSVGGRRGLGRAASSSRRCTPGALLGHDRLELLADARQRVAQVVALAAAPASALLQALHEVLQAGQSRRVGSVDCQPRSMRRRSADFEVALAHQVVGERVEDLVRLEIRHGL